ncbi:MAG: hypothetical protein IAC69_00110 [Proteobacteria bacterium]|uniref:Lipoprotein n=1 Tax=Candidatus Enterousia avistercoris TaxID=2840788 RepID=A0A9D9DEB4_9PROT|nr:hypothetical protein [Candidatus Enterousia avistercoris]
MKKKYAFSLLFLGLAACGGMIKPEEGSQYLRQLEAEPIGCTFLYKIESEVSVYDADDARTYLENRIVDQARPGNAYWITSQRTRPNEWVIFGPERSFILVANVYDCPHPNSVRTAKDPGATVVAPVLVEHQINCNGSMYGGQGC